MSTYHWHWVGEDFRVGLGQELGLSVPPGSIYIQSFDVHTLGQQTLVNLLTH